ncbi:hypothetical protein MAR_021187 [Mya arenaria]|uniref:Uncharacterized protein n=1 Tax=Mya arenaria TaxID=6604 RepID=A0ABY7E755_MYAAR|nr:hypothetical protein MAR_021187 [Mya arenaria]
MKPMDSLSEKRLYRDLILQENGKAVKNSNPAREFMGTAYNRILDITFSVNGARAANSDRISKSPFLIAVRFPVIPLLSFLFNMIRLNQDEQRKRDSKAVAKWATQEIHFNLQSSDSAALSRQVQSYKVNYNVGGEQFEDTKQALLEQRAALTGEITTTSRDVGHFEHEVERMTAEVTQTSE